MHPTLESVRKELSELGKTVMGGISSNEPINLAHGNWSFSGLTRNELVAMAQALEDLITTYGNDTLPDDEGALVADYVRRLQFLKGNTVPQIWGGNSALAVAAYQSTLNGLRTALEDALGVKNGSTEAEIAEARRKLRTAESAIRAIEARIASIDSRSTNLDEKIEVIENAHATADRLPTDMAFLDESRAKLELLMGASKTSHDKIQNSYVRIGIVEKALSNAEEEAYAILKRCDSAYSATTSQGLASAFAKRSLHLNLSMWAWVFGLLIALAWGSVVGGEQLRNLVFTLRTSTAEVKYGEIWINLILAVVSVAAPVWFAWISTKQIGQRFRLAEDYAYKASISKAYEGYRREAEAFQDPQLKARLFSSALTRLEELPLRLVETETHGSPWHELAASANVKEALRTVPGFAGRVADLAKSALASGSNKTTAAVTSEDEKEKSVESS